MLRRIPSRVEQANSPSSVFWLLALHIPYITFVIQGGLTALMVATHHDSDAIVHHLLRAKADVNVVAEVGL